MMLEGLFSMLPVRVCWAALALGASILPGCGPVGAPPETVPEAVATARALVRPHVARNALTLGPLYHNPLAARLSTHNLLDSILLLAGRRRRGAAARPRIPRA